MDAQVGQHGSGSGVKTCPSCGLSHEVDSQRCACGYQWGPPGTSPITSPARPLTDIWGPLLVAVGFVVFVMLASLHTSGTNDSAQTPSGVTTVHLEQTATPLVYREAESLRVGDLGYRVHRSEWRRYLSGTRDLDQSPDAAYLLVSISVENHDRQERPVPAFQLIDETGQAYWESEQAWRVEGSPGRIQHLKPGAQKDASLVFEVPHTRQYTLKVSGGECSNETALIALTPSPELRKIVSIGPLVEKGTVSPKPHIKKVSVKKTTTQEALQVGRRRHGFSSEAPSWPRGCNMATYDATLCAQAMRERVTQKR